MECRNTQRRLLALTDPGQPPPSIQSHLDDCPACREVQRQVALVERHLPRLGVPLSVGMSLVQHQIRTEIPVRERVWTWLRRRERWQVVSAAAAASVLLFIFLWRLAPGLDTGPPVAARQSSAPDPLLAKLFQRHQAMARAAGPREQIETLADLADDLRVETQSLSRIVDIRELKALAELFGKTVQTGVRRAHDLPAADRRLVLDPIVHRLDVSYNLAVTQAHEDRVSSVDHPLFSIGEAARRGKDQLLDLLKQDARGLDAWADALVWAGDGPVPAALRAPRWPLAAVRAEGAPRTLTSSEKVRHFERNRKLVEVLVASSLDLADRTDPIQRAGRCVPVIERLRDELSWAAAERNGQRLGELSQHLATLLKQGVAHNLTVGGAAALPGSPNEGEMRRIGLDVARLMLDLESDLGREAPLDPSLLSSLRTIQQGRIAVEITIQER